MDRLCSVDLDVFWRADSLRQRQSTPARAKLFILPLAALAACSNPHDLASRDSPTVYLRSADAFVERGDSAPRPRRSARSRATPSPTVARSSTPPVTVHSGVMARGVPPAPYDERVRKLRAEVMGRAEALSNDESDAVCLSLGLIPREQVFDHSVKPKKVLLHYVGEVNTEAELESIESAINELRR